MFYPLIIPDEIDVSITSGQPNQLAAEPSITRRYRNLPQTGPKFVKEKEKNGVKDLMDQMLRRVWDQVKVNVPMAGQIESSALKAYGELERFQVWSSSLLFGNGSDASVGISPIDLGQDGNVKAIAWHRTKQFIAICHRQDVVFIFDTLERRIPFYFPLYSRFSVCVI
jgi:hypothetical protein